MTNKLTVALLSLAALFLFLAQSLFIVDQRQQAIVLQLGEPVGDLRKAGPHFKIPFIQTVHYFDNRVLSVDPPPEQMVISSTSVPLSMRTEDPVKTEGNSPAQTSQPPEQGIENVSGEPIIVDSLARYRISDPLQFLKTLRSVDNAGKRIEVIMDEATRTVLGKKTLKQLLSKDRSKVMAEIRDRIIRKIKEDKLGITLVDVRIVRADLGESLRDSTVRRMISELTARATETRAKGEQEAAEIRAGAEREKTVLLANAERDAQIFRGQGDRTAIETYASAFNKDKEFYAFIRSMEAYKNTLANPETQMILSPDSDFFRFFENHGAR